MLSGRFVFGAVVVAVTPPAVAHGVPSRARAPLCLSLVFPGASLVWFGMGVLLRGRGGWGAGSRVRGVSGARFVRFGERGACVGALAVVIS